VNERDHSGPREAPAPVLLMVRELGPGGSERQLAVIARALDREQFEPHVGCFRPDGIRGDELRAAGIPILEIPVHSFGSARAFGAVRPFARYIRERGIRLVHTFDEPMNVWGVPAARAAGAGVVLSSQRAHRELVPPLRRHVLRFTDHLTDGVVVNCLAVRRHLIEDEKVPPSLIHLCYNGIDTAAFAPERRRPDLLASAGLTIGCVCALRPEKDLTTLARAFAAVRHLHPDMRLVIVGSGPSLPLLRDCCRSLDLENQCVFEPATSRVAEWLGGIDIFVLPSLSEAFSNALMEAMACGCSPVATRVGGNPELVEHGRTGFLVSPGKPEELAAVLRTLIENETLRRELACAASAKVRENFSIGAAARRMGEIYRHFLDRPGDR
jgi:glycosyltransferase involved in cell wall biosynthesis